MARQFLVSVSPSPEGYEATVSGVVVLDTDGPTFTGQGATWPAACLSALLHAKLAEPIPGPSKPPEVS